jgi:hypothetical protein
MAAVTILVLTLIVTAWLAICVADQIKRGDRLQEERDELLRQKQSLTQPMAKAQDAAKRPLRGAEIRRMAERVNAPAAEPTQAQRLENHG